MGMVMISDNIARNGVSLFAPTNGYVSLTTFRAFLII